MSSTRRPRARKLAVACRMSACWRQLGVGCCDEMDVVAIVIAMLIFGLLGALIAGFDRI
jgi:hypothetical protein